MNVEKAKEVQNIEEKRKQDLEESKKVIEADRIKKIQEKEEAEKKARKEAFEKEKLRYPKKAGELYQKCWHCKNLVNMSQAEYVSKASLLKILIIGVCGKCENFNIACVPTNCAVNSLHDQFIHRVNLG